MSDTTRPFFWAAMAYIYFLRLRHAATIMRLFLLRCRFRRTAIIYGNQTTLYFMMLTLMCKIGDSGGTDHESDHG
ncbi:MAG: hypothetical protein P8100_05595 [bacterium]